MGYSSTGLGINGQIVALGNYNGDLYVSGQFNTIGQNTFNHIARWNGSTWSSVGGGVTSFAVNFYSYDSILYALGGGFSPIQNPNIYGIAQWNGVTWDSVGPPLAYAYGTMSPRDAIFYNGYLYVTGSITSSGSVILNYIGRLANASVAEDISGTDLANKITVSPIPANNEITVSSDLFAAGAYSFSLADVSGRNITPGITKLTDRAIIDVSQLASGLYYVTINTSLGHITKKIIVAR